VLTLRTPCRSGRLDNVGPVGQNLAAEYREEAGDDKEPGGELSRNSIP
jgi:hypothetical protein